MSHRHAAASRPAKIRARPKPAEVRFTPPPFSTRAGGDRSTHPELDAGISKLRGVLGDEGYELLARKGEAMTTAEMAKYAYDQIDHAQAELNAVSKDGI